MNKKIPKIKNKISTIIPKETWILFLSLIFVSIFGLIVQQIKYNWADNPFQKIILAPLSEEPIKIMWAFIFILSVSLPLLIILYLFDKESIRDTYFSNIFRFGFVYASAFSGFLFGYFEFLYQGGTNSPSLHFSLTTIAGILIVITYNILKNYKKILSFFTLIVPMILHSIANQYTNFTSVKTDDAYLIQIAKFLQNNTFLKDQTVYANTLLLLALVFLLIYSIKYVLIPWIYKNESRNANNIDKINLKYWLNSYSNVIILGILSFVIAYFIISGIWYDLTINVTAGLICSLITVFLFTYLFERKEKIIWSAVKDEVTEGLKIELSGILIDIMLPLEGVGNKFVIKSSHEDDVKEAIRKHRLQQFKKLVEAEKIEFSESFKKILATGGFGTLFISRKEYLNEIEYKYSKHLNPDIVLSIIKLQNYLGRIGTRINIKAKKRLFLETDEEFYKELSELFHNVLKELYNLYEKNLIYIY